MSTPSDVNDRLEESKGNAQRRRPNKRLDKIQRKAVRVEEKHGTERVYRSQAADNRGIKKVNRTNHTKIYPDRAKPVRQTALENLDQNDTNRLCTDQRQTDSHETKATANDPKMDTADQQCEVARQTPRLRLGDKPLLNEHPAQCNEL